MRADPLEIIINDKFKFDKNFYFISGNEITLIEKIKEIIIINLKKNNQLSTSHLRSVESFNNDVGLFEKNTVYIVGDISKLDSGKLDNISSSGDIFIFPFQNNPKIKNTKNIFLKRKDSLLVDCYELSRENKAKIFNAYISKNEIKVEQSIFWAVVDKLDSRYGFFINELKKVSIVKNKHIDKNVLEKIITREGSGVEKMFFKVLKKNQELIDHYNNKIISQSDVNDFFYTFKQYSLLIINSTNENDFTKKIPMYLFKEKPFFLNIFKMYNQKKKSILLDLLQETEKSLRKNSNLSQIIGLRFYLGFKKITIS